MTEAVSSSETSAPERPRDLWAVEDHEGFRRTIVRVLKAFPGVGEVRSFGRCEDAVEALRTGASPRVILLDVNLPGISGVEGARHIKSLSPSTDVIMLTVLDDHATLVQALCAGASGYLLKTVSPESIHQSITEVVNGGAPMSPQIARSVLGLFTRYAPQDSDERYGLSPREKEVLTLLVQGQAKKEIAYGMELSYHTVDKYVRAIYKKLQVHSLSAAVAKAVKERLF